MRGRIWLSGLALGAALAADATAASLRVAPVLLQLEAPQQTASLSVWNDGPDPVDVQVRVLRWRQANGEDVLEPTADVVVSPPISTLTPGAENVIRVVRVAGAPVAGEEAYRVLVDELPDPARMRAGAVTLVVRHSIPVFFAAAGAPASVVWRASHEDGAIRLTAENAGARHLRIANLKLAAGGRALAVKDGLVGYVLGGASASWTIPSRDGGAPGPVNVTADSETGRIDAIAAPSGR